MSSAPTWAGSTAFRLGRHLIHLCQNHLVEEIPDHHNTSAVRILDRHANDLETIHVLQPGKEDLEVEAAPVIDTEIDLHQIGADR